MMSTSEDVNSSDIFDALKIKLLTYEQYTNLQKYELVEVDELENKYYYIDKLTRIKTVFSSKLLEYDQSYIYLIY
ncbi:hypothetical protein ManeNPV_00041 [Malacosoma neustria nucleopolyhedrovirus]|uniref:hypothetical protein n=1 Tax=Malacosoma neustria nuclear polyhedrosis virus TaxID=38012 RepID=UPI000E35FFB5|nr:hypothetical protein ManeNPV_00041 [Malacosoma neustria nucleopolyhedrovirus]AUF81569.1 hypothetical protein ManeNPV_00041 [Malacosoma neustria nucleopolyhedrovirus]